ncbi:DUF2062 domain-containing protein [Pontibacter toksunensis]|uniref:DUF2062 domain-containing protein n=1 Tax=Pontibacter toksunensis TaxID=1332631 RepID=A0ABW6BR14_9BACT
MLNLLKQGMTPGKLAATVAVGTVVGIMPILGLTTVLSTAIAARFRLNIAATVLVSYLVQPLQLLLALPFIRMGISLFGLSELRLSLSEMQAMFMADWVEALNKLWLATLAGISVWALLSLPIGGMLYLLLRPIFNRVLPKPAMIVAEVIVTEPSHLD